MRRTGWRRSEVARSMTRSHRFVIIGAGPTGLGAAAQLAARGESSFVILEAAGAPGGLARSFRDADGFTWDLSCHLHYSHYQHVDRWWDAALSPDHWLDHRRSTWVWLSEPCSLLRESKRKSPAAQRAVLVRL